MENRTIKEQVKKLRIAKKITPYRLAKNAGVTTSTVYNLEQGTPVSVTTLQKIADALGHEIILKPKTEQI